MKRILFSGLLIALAVISHSQCIQTFKASNNGNAGNSTFPGFGNVNDNNYQAPDPNYSLSGQILVSFDSPLPLNVAPPAIITVKETSPGTTTYNYKYALVSVSNNRTSAIYNFYGTTGSQNLPNGSQVKYAITIQYVGQSTTTCTGVSNTQPLQVLPVRFSSFDASRSSQSRVSITWTTAMEENNRGFNVQRYINGEWKTIAFVFSQTEHGSSSSTLTYSYNDVNTEKGITQYRIQQVDLDGHFTYSDIRSIRGETTAAKVTVYPNPSTDGRLNIVFENNTSVHDVVVNDMQGKIVKSYKGITNNVLLIERLSSGFYTIQIANCNTATSSVQKVIVR